MPGKDNTVADALSRYTPFAAVTQIYKFSQSELLTAVSYNLWSRVIYVLESGDDFTLPHLRVPFSSFTLQNDVFCRTVAISKDEVTQLVIAAALVHCFTASS